MVPASDDVGRWKQPHRLGRAEEVTVTSLAKRSTPTACPLQCTPGPSGGTPDSHAAALPGHTVVHLHGALSSAVYDGWAENLFAPASKPSSWCSGSPPRAVLRCAAHGLENPSGTAIVAPTSAIAALMPTGALPAG